MRPPRLTKLSPPTVVILGGGFGGLATAKYLRRLARSGRARLRLISDNEAFVYTPFLCEVAGGSIEHNHLHAPSIARYYNKIFNALQEKKTLK